MTNDERDIISRFVARFGGSPQGSNWGSVPAAQPAAPLPPIDPEADQLIGTLFAQYPEARYRITQLAFVQEAALTEAQHRIERLQWELQQVQQQAQEQLAQVPQSRGLLGGLFGGGPRATTAPLPPPPAPPQYSQYAPQPQMFQQGSGFLGSALHTAAGVAGGLVLGNAIMDLFGSRQGFGGGFGGGGFGGGVPSETVVNNYYGDDQGNTTAGGADPWGGAGTQIDPSGGDNWSSQDDGGGSDNSGQGDDISGGDSGGGDWGN